MGPRQPRAIRAVGGWRGEGVAGVISDTATLATELLWPQTLGWRIAPTKCEDSMKLFQQLLLAPAALGLLAPMAAGAAELNIAGVSQYTSQEQVTSISQFSDVKPTDWAYQALSNLIERYGCVAGYPNGTFKGGQAMTRFEAAALLNACLDRVTEVTDELKRLMKEFQKELAILKGRVDGLEARVGELEANQFSTTTKLKGYAAFVLGGNSYGGNGNVVTSAQFAGAGLLPLSDRSLKNYAKATQGGTSFNYDVRLDLDTSFTGKDLLRTRLRAGNFGASAYNGGSKTNISNLTGMETSFQDPAGANVVSIDRLFYKFPVGDGFNVVVGPRVRQDDMLAMWPSAYPADTVLDIFTYAGAPGAYSLNLGGGAGVTYAKNGFNASLNYVSSNANSGSPVQKVTVAGGAVVNNPIGGGIGTSAAVSTFTAQLGYAGSNYGAAFAYTYGQNGAGPYGGNATPLALSGFTGSNSNYGLSAYWSPKETGFIPSISTGWGYSTLSGASGPAGVGLTGAEVTAAQNWYVGLQWADAFLKGNTLGMAFGQPTFATSQFKGKPNDGNYAWEWWYKFQVTDNISVTPAIYYLSAPTGAIGREVAGGNALTNFGGLVKTTFKF